MTRHIQRLNHMVVQEFHTKGQTKPCWMVRRTSFYLELWLKNSQGWSNSVLRRWSSNPGMAFRKWPPSGTSWYLIQPTRWLTYFCRLAGTMPSSHSCQRWTGKHGGGKSIGSNSHFPNITIKSLCSDSFSPCRVDMFLLCHQRQS